MPNASNNNLRASPVEALQVVEDGREEADEPADTLAVVGADLKERLVALEGMAHSSHTIPPDVLETILQQAAKRAMQHVIAQLRKTADILEALEK